MTWAIRLAAPVDSREIGGVHVESWRETYTGIVPASVLASVSVDGRTAMWEQIITTPVISGSTNVYVAEAGHKIVGFGSCGSQRTETLKDQGYEGEISAIYVLKAFQGRTIGASLLAAMASDLSSRGLRSASLWVLHNNTRARQFYEHYQARVIGERQDTLPDGALVEVAYGWSDLAELTRLTSR